MKSVTLTTDGACIGNPGPGGWACILRFDRFWGEMYGSEPHTTNNRMELKAVIQGLEALKEPCKVDLSTDSQYVKLGITEWLDKWKKSGWITSKRSGGRPVPVSNQDLWISLDGASRRHTVRWHWVRGHHLHADNIRCDKLANQAARQQISSDGLRTYSELGFEI